MILRCSSDPSIAVQDAGVASIAGFCSADSYLGLAHEPISMRRKQNTKAVYLRRPFEDDSAEMVWT